MNESNRSLQSGGNTEVSNAWVDEGVEDDFKPLTQEEARQWRIRNPEVSVWRVVFWQAALCVLVGLAGWLYTKQAAVSALLGGLSVLLPSAVMAYGLTSSGLAKALAAMFPGMAKASLAGVLFWEGIKVLLVLAMLWSAPRLVSELNWLALVAGLVVVLKAYWLEFFLRSRSKP
jgi:ATP synthase protein I